MGTSLSETRGCSSVWRLFPVLIRFSLHVPSFLGRDVGGFVVAKVTIHIRLLINLSTAESIEKTRC